MSQGGFRASAEDAKEFKRLYDAFGHMGFSPEEIKVPIAILHFSQ